MKRLWLGLILLAVLLGLGFWGWSVFFPSPERAIRNRLQALARTASFPPREAPLAQAWNSQKLGEFFTTDVEVKFDTPGHSPYTLNGREELTQAAMSARSALTSLKIEFPDINIAVGPDRKSAIVDLTAKGNVPGERDPFVQELKFNLKKIGGDWLIRRVETVRTLIQ